MDNLLPLIGQTIPDLTLEIFHQEKIKKINLAQYRGSWLILFFYPADFTFVCPTELAELAQNYNEFRKLKAEIISISCDTAFFHNAWHKESPLIKQITFPMGADPAGKLAQAFGAYLTEEGLARRATFLIDPDGVIKAMEMHDNTLGRNSQELLRKLQAAIFLRENKGQLCPASWQPGSPAIIL